MSNWVALMRGGMEASPPAYFPSI